MKDMKKYNGYDELSDRKQMQHWAGSKKFHDDNDKSIAKLEKEKEEKEKRKAKDFKNTTPCYMKPSNVKTTKKKVNENSVVKLNESQLRKIVAESVKKVLKEGILSGGHGDAIRQTYDTVKELLSLWSSVRGSDGKYTEVGDKITHALYNVKTTIEQIDIDALDGDEGSEFSPYGLKKF